jgi:hypothetical protein
MSKCFPLFTQQRTSPRYFGISASCQHATLRHPINYFAGTSGCKVGDRPESIVFATGSSGKT